MGDTLDDFIDDAQDSNATMAWLEKQVRWNYAGTIDICPTSTTRGNNDEEATLRSGSETYSTQAPWADPRGTGKHYTYWCNCTPEHAYYDGAPIPC